MAGRFTYIHYSLRNRSLVLFYLRLYSNGNTNVGTVRKYLPPDGDDEALFHIVHDDDDSEDLDGHECFAAMEQYRKNFSTFDSNSCATS